MIQSNGVNTIMHFPHTHASVQTTEIDCKRNTSTEQELYIDRYCRSGEAWGTRLIPIHEDQYMNVQGMGVTCGTEIRGQCVLLAIMLHVVLRYVVSVYYLQSVLMLVLW